MSECNLQNELKLISKGMNIPEGSTITTCLGEASYVRLIKHPIVIHNEGSCASVQVGVHVGSTSTIDPNISAIAVELLEKLEYQEESGSFEDLVELSFIILESGEYRLYIDTDNYTSFYDFEDITMFDYVLNNKLHEAE